MIDLIITGILGYVYSNASSFSFKIILETLKKFKKGMKLEKLLLQSINKSIEDIQSQIADEHIKNLLNNVKKEIKSPTPEIKQLLKDKDIVPSKRNEIFVNHCKAIFLQQSLPEDVQKRLLDCLFINCSKALKSILNEYSDEFQKEALSILEKSEKSDEEKILLLKDVINDLKRHEIILNNLNKKLTEIELKFEYFTLDQFDNNLEQLNANRNFKQQYALEIVNNIENTNNELKNRNLVEIHYLKLYNEFIPKGIQSQIRCGNIKSQELFENLNKIKDKGRNLDLIYWIGDIFHLLDNYNTAEQIVSNIENVENGTISNIFDINLLHAHILMHKNELNNSLNAFFKLLDDELSIEQRAECLFRLGEIKLYQGLFSQAIDFFNDSNSLIDKENFRNNDIEKVGRLLRFKGDNHRKLGTTYIMIEDLDKSKEHYTISKDIYSRCGSRGKVWLLHGYAELSRAEGDLDISYHRYQIAEKASHESLNINRVAHCYLGMAEICRMKGKPNFNYYSNCFSIYKLIESDWGITNTLISRGLANLARGYEEEGWNDLDEAKTLSNSVGFTFEKKLIENLSIENVRNTLHPLSFF